MHKHLTPEEQKFAQKAAEDRFRYEKATEAHMSAVRKDMLQDPARYFAVYEEHTKNASLRSMPPKVELDGVVASCEASLAKECTTHIDAISASMFLVSVLGYRAAEMGEHVRLEMIRLHTQMFDNDPPVPDPAGYNLPPGFDVNSFSVGIGAPRSAAVEHHWQRLAAEEDADPSSHFPNTLHISKPLSWDELSELPRVAVTSTDATGWKNDPQPLLDGAVFLDPDGMDGEPEPFRVHSFTTFLKGAEIQHMFYVQLAEDDEAYAYTSDHFFEMLAKSERVVQG
ncbi:hypothetical protein B0H19DRAFT_1239641 [Mycena capillaripes]|nr:hypothetical protein B0H19DRAFT_1239641 [Mycena capillaripes]